jgi:hypothetical protein
VSCSASASTLALLSHTSQAESGDGKEIHGSDNFTMIAQKGQPALRGLRVLGRPFHPAGNGSFRHVEAEHQEFAMDARRTRMVKKIERVGKTRLAASNLCG